MTEIVQLPYHSRTHYSPQKKDTERCQYILKANWFLPWEVFWITTFLLTKYPREGIGLWFSSSSSDLWLFFCLMTWSQIVLIELLDTLEIKPCGLDSRIREVEAFWYKTEIKIIYFVQLCSIALIVCYCTLTLNFWYLKLKTTSFIFLMMEANFFWSYVIMQGICNKFIEVNFCVGCMVWRPNRL